MVTAFVTKCQRCERGDLHPFTTSGVKQSKDFHRPFVLQEAGLIRDAESAEQDTLYGESGDADSP